MTEKRIKKHGHISRFSKFKREIEKSRKKTRKIKKINYETNNKYITRQRVKYNIQ